MRYIGPEKRKYLRFNANYVVSYRMKEAGKDFDLTQTKDVSQGGAIITADKKFEKGVQIVMRVRFPFMPDRLEITGEVVECREVIKGSVYEIRMKFVDLAPEYFSRIGEFINKDKAK